MKDEGSYLRFIRCSPSTPRKTLVYVVRNLADDSLLGRVSFWPAWRKYVFFPAESTLFDCACLLEIATFVSGQTAKWRKSIKWTAEETAT
jgi:hypothetical protein